MTRPQRARFPAACRRFLTRLDELVDTELLAEADAHHVECARCADRLRAARQNSALLRGLGSPVIPPEVRSPEMLSRVYERSAAMVEQELGPALRAALGPVKAPADVAWLETDHAALERSLRAVFTRARSPGWMWRRIRSALTEAEPEPRRLPAWLGRAGLAAAALLVCGLLVIRDSLESRATKQGTSPPIDVVFQTIPEPFEPAFSLGSLAEAGR